MNHSVRVHDDDVDAVCVLVYAYECVSMHEYVCCGERALHKVRRHGALYAAVTLDITFRVCTPPTTQHEHDSCVCVMCVCCVCVCVYMHSAAPAKCTQYQHIMRSIYAKLCVRIYSLATYMHASTQKQWTPKAARRAKGVWG